MPWAQPAAAFTAISCAKELVDANGSKGGWRDEVKRPDGV